MKKLVIVSLLSTALFCSPYVVAKNTDSNSPDVTTTKNVNVSDQKITTSIKSSYKKQNMLDNLNVDVTSNNGVVTLSGPIDSDSQAELLIGIAQSTAGVKDVEADKLEIKEGKQPFADTLITAKIKGILIREDLFGEKDIASLNTNVETKDGIVYLTGVTENKEQIKNAVNLIKKNVKGIKKIEYNVRVEPANA